MQKLSYLKSNKRDVALMASAASVLFLATLIVSGKRPLWYDEIFSWTLITDPSFRHMVYALRLAAESPPGLYHVLARMWLAVTGSSTLSLRLFSTFASVVALVAIWTTLRRAFSLRATAVGVLTVFCTSAMMLFHSAEARYYPFFVACVALAIVAYARAIESDKVTWRLIAALFVCNLAVVQAHIYGVAYSAALLFALICCDLAERRLRPRVYLWIAATWLSLLPLLPVLRRVNEATKPRHWIEPPTFSGVIEFYRLYSTELPVILLVVVTLCLAGRILSAHEAGAHAVRNAAAALLGAITIAAAFFGTDAGLPHVLVLSVLLPLTAQGILQVDTPSDRLPPTPESEPASRRLRRALLVLAVVLVAAPPAAAIFSLVVKPVFIPKYVLPSFMGMAILLTWLVEKGNSGVVVTARRNLWLTIAWTIFLGTLLAMPVWSALREDPRQAPRYGIANWEVEELVPRGTPVAVENFHLFLPLRQAASPGGPTYSYIADLESASDPRAYRSALLHYRGAQLWKSLGYLGAEVAAPYDFVSTHAVFAVVHSPEHLWFERGIRNNPAYAWRTLGKIGPHEVLLVMRKPMGAAEQPVGVTAPSAY